MRLNVTDGLFLQDVRMILAKGGYAISKVENQDGSHDLVMTYESPKCACGKKATVILSNVWLCADCGLTTLRREAS